MWSELERALAHINSIRTATWPVTDTDALEALLERPKTRLAAYGTLQPGQSNHAMLAAVGGSWLTATVQGVRFMANGYPAFKWGPGPAEVPVSVLTADGLADQWARLDDFEGADYRRILVPARLPNGTILVANLYEYAR
jgi:gamma-glutamylcyclotransferase (GGCT)/AIG2-like uncharacterized protein YtfP